MNDFPLVQKVIAVRSIPTHDILELSVPIEDVRMTIQNLTKYWETVFAYGKPFKQKMVLN